MSWIALKEKIRGLLRGPGETGFGWSTTASDVTEELDITGQTILVTGCNSGLGKETMRVLARRGATVYGSARNHQKAKTACESMDGSAKPLVCDLAKPDTILDMVEHVRQSNIELDVVVANAGIMALPELQQVHGIEKQFFVNYVGHFLLVTELLDCLKTNGRVVLLTSTAHQFAPESGIDFGNLSGEDGYDPWEAYGRSKLAMLLFARELHRRMEDYVSNGTAYGVHPGVINTNLTRKMGTFVNTAMKVLEVLCLKSIPQGAATQTFAAVHPRATNYSGEYLVDCNPADPQPVGRDDSLAKKLWDESQSMVEPFRR
ncbi:MAG: SDR family NAD(P)-dependent oxidoreductase [bacterium]